MEVQPLTRADAEAIAAWRYEGRYSTYDVHEVVTPAGGYCSFGDTARVPGVDGEEGTLDIGYGMRPDLVGQGLGRAFVAAILAFGVRRFSPQWLRVLILSWNARSRKVAEALGFEETGRVPGAEGDFLVLVRPGS
jgi:RimJ/RimL family protein N-acetyltransferase